jgi:hypothetical protein
MQLIQSSMITDRSEYFGGTVDRVHRSASVCNYLWICRIPVHIDHSRARMARIPQYLLKESFSGSRITSGRQEKINRRSRGIHSSIKRGLLAAHSKIRFIDPPRSILITYFRTTAAVHFWCVSLNPAPDRDMVDRQLSFRHKFLDVPVTEAESQITTNAQDDHFRFEMSPFEHCRPVPPHPPQRIRLIKRTSQHIPLN